MVNYMCMELSEVRKQNGLTQKEAAMLIGVPLLITAIFVVQKDIMVPIVTNRFVTDMVG